MPDPVDSLYSDLDAYIALPRITGLALSPDGSRLVLSVNSLDPKKTAYRGSLWEVPTDGSAPARRLTRSDKGESGAAFTASGDLLFVSGRADADADEESDTTQLWRLPDAGGEAQQLTDLAGGVDAVAATALSADTVILSAPVLHAATSLVDDRDRRRIRDDKKVTAILHDRFPVRYWDHDLGPAEPHLVATEVAASDERPTLTDLTPHPGRAFDNGHAALTPDGRTAFSTRGVPEQRGSRETIVRIDIVTGESTTILDEQDVDFQHPTVSPDGRRIAYFRSPRATTTMPGDIELWVADLDGADAARLVSDWDRWPTSVSFGADGDTLILTADQNGRGPIFSVDIGADTIEQLTDDDFAYSSVRVDRSGSALYALRSSWLAPEHPVRIALADHSVTVLPSVVELPEPPSTMTEVHTTAEDGTPLRAWLLLPTAADKPAPLLLWIHGGPLNSWNAWSWRWNPQLLVERGYAVLLPDPALSTGYGREFIRRGWASWGDAPFTDLMGMTDAALARDDIDESRVAAMGGSFGGYMANWVAGHTDRFAAIVSHASLWALDQFVGTTDMGVFWQREFTADAAALNSPNAAVGDIRTPMLVIHGDHDYRVPIGESLRLWADLMEHHASPDGTSDHKLLVFPDENHWILKPQHAVVWYDTVFAFLDEHVQQKEWKRPGLLG